MKVSCTVVREALMPLEEDGPIRARRGVGGSVSDTLPAPALNASAPSRKSRRPRTAGQIKPSRAGKAARLQFDSPGVGVHPGTDSGSGSRPDRDGEPIAHLQGEYLRPPPPLRRLGRRREIGYRRTTAAPLARGSQQSGWGRALGPESANRASEEGPSRAKPLDLRASDPVLVPTQYVRNAKRPFDLAKCLIADRAGHLSVMQSLQS